tara:strand:+ start:186 stop:1436 length:1251 start_codon:yes stop_codon:yes gene_type:complete
MKKIIFWYDKEDEVNSWIPEYDDWLKASPAFDEDSYGYWHKCLGIGDYVEPLSDHIDIEKRLLSDWEENDSLNIYALSIQQLILSNFNGMGTIIDNIPYNTQQLLRDKKLKLLILNHREGWPAEKFLPSIKVHFEYNNMENIDAYVFTANLKVDEKIWARDGIKRIFNVSEFENITLQQNETNTEYKKHEKKNDYISLNRIVRSHRMALYSELDRLQILDKGAFSFVGVSYLDKYPGDVVKADKEDYVEINKLLSGAQLDHFEKFEMKKRTVDVAHFFLNDPIDLYNTAYINLVTETHFMENSGFLTEKIFKSFIHYKPFLLMGEHGSLARLRDMGYHTFPELFDESYDNILNPAERFNAVMNQLRNWCMKSKDQKDELIDSVENKVIYNNNLFFSEKNISKKVKENLSMFEQMEN